ncbi:MAG: protein phosphatase 2C domain-containing protein [Myxococcota bacterium]|nr:protein phosphatase 2C domain-containing protein [Myxococcota bacterium]
MISQDQLIPTLILLLMQLRNAGQTRSRIAAILNEKEEWQLQWSDEEATQADNIQIIFSQLLSIYSPNCETNIPREVLVAHLGMLCPDIPEDLLFILQNVFSPASYGYCHDLEHIIHALGQSQIRKEIRTSPESNTTTHWSLAYDTHIGMRKAQLGQTNQDYFFFGLNNENALLMVADGISYSTAGSGNMASHIATQVIDHFWNTEKGKLLQATGDEIISFLKTALFNANIYICDMAKRLSKDKLEEEVPMGTTIVLAYLQKDTVYLTHLGDSRAYLITEDGAALLTGDHNIRGERIKHGIETDFN